MIKCYYNGKDNAIVLDLPTYSVGHVLSLMHYALNFDE